MNLLLKSNKYSEQGYWLQRYDADFGLRNMFNQLAEYS